MDEDVLAAVVGLDEAVPLGGVEPFHGAVGHFASLDLSRFLPCRGPWQGDADNRSRSGKRRLRFRRSLPLKLALLEASRARSSQAQSTDCGRKLRTPEYFGQPES